MLARIFTATTVGLQPVKIEVEVDGNRGIPAFILIGLPSKAIDEAKERITSALHNCGIKIKSKRTIVNLAPADLPKHGSSFDLAIAIGLLKMYGEIRVDTDHTMFFGELSLDGTLKRIRGALPLVLAAREAGFTDVVLPDMNRNEVSIISGVRIHPIKHIREYLTFAQGQKKLPSLQSQKFVPHSNSLDGLDFLQVIGQEKAKRALTVAAAGGHNILLNGSPGAGKSLLAKTLVTILPPLSETEAIETTNIYSICGLTAQGLITTRPFRSPHHSISTIGLIGGGSVLKPGEISLAHRGVLFLDELLEFSHSTLEALRQPLEDRQITVARSAGSLEYPSHFMLVAATNPCPCGFRGSTLRDCHCTPEVLARYQKKLSGPLLDRIDLHVHVKEVEIEKLKLSGTQPPTGPTSQQLRQQVITTREIQIHRFKGTNILTNADIPSHFIHTFCPLNIPSQFLLEKAAKKYALSARSYFKVIKVARTIADLAQKPKIELSDLTEALQYRSPDLLM